MICLALCQQELVKSGDFWKPVPYVGTKKQLDFFWKMVFQRKKLNTCQSDHKLLKFWWFNTLGQRIAYLRQWKKTLVPLLRGRYVNPEHQD